MGKWLAIFWLVLLVGCGRHSSTTHRLGSGSGPSPVCLVNGLSAPQDVAGGSTVSIALQSATGAQYWSIQATSTDELNTAAAVNATLVINAIAKTATFTAPGAGGSAVIFTSIVGISQLGYDQNFNPQPSYTTTFKVNVRATNGAHVLAFDEQQEQNATFGWITEINPCLRGTAACGTGGGGGGGGSTVINFAPVNCPATVAAQPGVKYGVNVTSGACTFTVGSITSAPTYSFFGVMAWVSDPSVSGHSITIDAPSGGQIQSAEVLSSYSSSSTTMTIAGESAIWMYDGTNLVIPP
jgi:hypothetical protein